MAMKAESENVGKGYDFSRSATSHKRFKFGARDSNAITVDISLANLFQRLTVECSGILGNPQWKHFRHMELMKTDQIRLSNGIWRSWHMQFQKGLTPHFCTFEIDPKRDEMSHKQPQAIVLEGKYWKRTDSAVALEYRKWRLFAKRRANWPNIRRLPNVANVSSSKQQQPDPQPMQAESADFRLSQIFQAIDDFPESLFMDIPRPGDERSYMRPLVDTAEIIQQPYLGMLNPHVDEMVFEPMEVMFPPLNFSNRFSGNFATTGASSSSFSSPQQPVTDQSDSRLQKDGSRSFPSTPIHYDSQTTPPFVNIPLPRGGGGYHQPDTLPYEMSPAAFLPVDPRMRSQSEVMDIGTPPVESLMKPNVGVAPKLYESGQGSAPGTPYQQTLPFIQPVSNDPQDKISSLLTQFMGDAPVIPAPPPPTDTTHQHGNNSMPATPTDYCYPTQHVMPERSFTSPSMQQPQAVAIGRTFETRKVSSGEMRGKTELEIQLIAEQMKQLEEEHMENLRELEQQQQIASQQYLELLQEYLSRSGSQRPTQQQHQVLMSVLSDPTSLSILKAIFKEEESNSSTSANPPQQVQGQGQVSGSIGAIVKKERGDDRSLQSGALGHSYSGPSRSETTPMLTTPTSVSGSVPMIDKSLLGISERVKLNN